MPLPPESDLEIGYVETIKIPVGMSCQTVAIGWILKKLADRAHAFDSSAAILAFTIRSIISSPSCH